VEGDAVLELNNLKACWDQLCFDAPRLVVRLRKLGSAGLLTVWAHKIFSQCSRIVGTCAPSQAFSSPKPCHNQTDPGAERVTAGARGGGVTIPAKN
jgi:hypothetical protein